MLRTADTRKGAPGGEDADKEEEGAGEEDGGEERRGWQGVRSVLVNVFNARAH